MTEYVSPFQEPGHEGPCHDMKIAAEPAPADASAGAELPAIPVRIVAYEGEGLTLAAGELQPTPETAGDVSAVKRSLATLLRELAGELDEQADAAQLEGQLDDGDRAEGDA